MGSFGDRLKKEREQRSISLDDISLSTKIGTRMLRALEEERFEQLPGGIFNKGFVRAYARHVGLDEEQTLADYMEALGESRMQALPEVHAAKPEPAPEHRPVAHAGGVHGASEIPWGMLALVLLLIVLAFASWSYYHRAPQMEKSTNAPAPATETTVPSGSAPSSGPPNAAPSPDQTAPASNDGKAPSTPIPTTEKMARSSPVAQAALHEVPSGTFTVLLKGNDDAEECWVSIVADGQPSVEVTLVAPEQKVIQAKNEVIVKAGSIGALDVFFNGQKVPLQGGYGVVKTLTFHSDGLQTPPLKPVAAAPQ